MSDFPTVPVCPVELATLLILAAQSGDLTVDRPWVVNLAAQCRPDLPAELHDWKRRAHVAKWGRGNAA